MSDKNPDFEWRILNGFVRSPSVLIGVSGDLKPSGDLRPDAYCFSWSFAMFGLKIWWRFDVLFADPFHLHGTGVAPWTS
jgi:hypothetical protein